MNTIEKCKYLKELGYTYNPDTGDVFSHKGKLIKQPKNNYKRLYFRIDKIIFFTRIHQFAFYTIYGYVPELIDHINRVKNDNRIINLREVTQQENNFNTNAKGYSWHKRQKKWQASIRKDYKVIHLGCFEIEEEARNAYLEAKKIYHIIK